MCDKNCLECRYEDCIVENPGLDVEQFLDYIRWDGEYVGAQVDIPPLVIVPDENIIELIQGDKELYSWCESKGVMPRVKADVAILRRAYKQGLQGKKLEKAIYKVRHREEYLAEKRRWHKRQQMKKAAQI